MNPVRELLERLNIMPKRMAQPTENELALAFTEQRIRELEARLRMNELDLRNTQRKI